MDCLCLRWERWQDTSKVRGDGMTEAIAFIAGLVAMAVVWFINDNSPDTSPYAHGYVEGYKNAMKKHKRREEEK